MKERREPNNKPKKVLLDLHDTVVDREGNFNTNLFEILRLFEITEVAFLTHIEISDQPSINTPQLDSNDKLMEYGIEVTNVYMPLDLEVSRKPGEFYNQYYEEIERAARKLKQDDWFGATDHVPAAQRLKIIERFTAFMEAYQEAENKDLLGFLDITVDNQQAMEELLAVHKKGFEFLQKNRNSDEAEKHHVRAQLEGYENNTVIFVDDSLLQRNSYAMNYEDDLVFRPPHSLGHTDPNSYSPCGYFVRELVKKTGGFPVSNQTNIGALVALADQDKAAGFSQDALYLYKLAYAIASQRNDDDKDQIAQTIRELEESNLSLASQHNLPCSDYGLPDIYAGHIGDIQALSAALEAFHERLSEVRVSIPSAFKTGFLASIQRFFFRFFGSNEAKDIVDTALGNLGEACVKLSQFSPKVQSYCIKEMEQFRQQYAFSEIKTQLKNITPALPQDIAIIKDIINDRIAHSSFATGLRGLTGVAYPEKKVNIPNGVNAILKTNNLDSMIASAKQSSTHISFFRAEDTQELYDEIASISTNSLGGPN